MFKVIKPGAFFFVIVTGLIYSHQSVAQVGEFTVRGFANTSFQWHDDESTFGDLALTPIFLWATDRILVESELEIEVDGAHGAALGLGYMSMNYDLTPGLRVQVGKLLLPFGIFGPRLHPSWINKLPTAPLGFSHDDLSPMSDLGAALRGIKPLGNFRLGYSAYVVNGPQLLTDTLQAGMLQFGIEDNNAGKSLGGRLELAHLSTGSWEIGLSGIIGEAGPVGLESMAALGAVDFSYQRVSTLLHGVIDMKSQANWIQVDRTDYRVGNRFDNQNWNYVVQFSYRPTLLEAQWIRNLETVCRVAQLEYSPNAYWSREGTELALGLNYWLNWNSLVKAAWIMGGGSHGEATMVGMPGMSATDGDAAHGSDLKDGKLVLQVAIGL